MILKIMEIYLNFLIMTLQIQKFAFVLELLIPFSLPVIYKKKFSHQKIEISNEHYC